MDWGILLYYKWTVCSKGHRAGRARSCYRRKNFVTMCPWRWSLWPLFPWFINLKYRYKQKQVCLCQKWKQDFGWHLKNWVACGLQRAPVRRDNSKLWHNEHRRRISQKHNRENTPKDIHCRMNHRFLGKCRRGSARSPASMWGLPIIRGSDLNVTYIIAFFFPLQRQPCRTPQEHWETKKPQPCPDLWGWTLSYYSHAAFMV